MNKNKHIRLNKKTKILIITFSILIALFLLIFGLFRISKEYYYKHTDEGRKEKVLLYLEKKYHQEFEVLFINDETVLFNAWIEGKKYIAKCMPKGGDLENDVFDVWIKPTRFLNFSYKGRYAEDNYFGLLIKQDYEIFISDIIKNYFSNFEVNLSFDPYDYKLNDKSTLKDFLKQDYNYVTMTIHIYHVINDSNEDIKMQLQDMHNDFMNNKISGSGFIYIVDESGNEVNYMDFYTNLYAKHNKVIFY